MTDLVVQGPPLAGPAREAIIDRLEQATGTAAVPGPCSGGVRFPQVGPEQLRAPPDAPGCDIAFVPENKGLADFKLLALDMDSTLIAVECIDELAAMAGIKPAVAQITASAMRGEIPFAESLRRRVALLSGLPEAALGRVYRERVRLSPGAETLLEAARMHHVATLLVSGGFTWFTDRLRDRLGIDRARANELDVVQGALTGQIRGPVFDGDGKAEAVRAYAEELAVRREQILVIGDGANDLAMMKLAGASVAFRAKPAVRAQADYALDYSGLEGVLNLFPPARP